MYSIEVRFVDLSMLPKTAPRATIYKNIGVRNSTLERSDAYYREHGSPWRDLVHRSLHAISFWIHDRLMSALVSLVRHNPRALLREHAAMLKAMRDHPTGDFLGLRCSQSTVDLHMWRLGCTRKIFFRLFRESSEPVPRAHAVAQRRIPR